jgi:hypothetical protein
MKIDGFYMRQAAETAVNALDPTSAVDERLTVRMSPFPAWLWDVVASDGKVIRRFKTDEDLQRWWRLLEGFSVGGKR